MKLKYMWKNECMADIEVDVLKNIVSVTNYTADPLNRPFGVNESPTMADFERFIENRCFPKARANCGQLLADFGLDHYDPLAIIRHTHGRQWDDFNWILFEGEELDYERDVKLRD